MEKTSPLNIVRFGHHGMDIVYALVGKCCYMTLLPTGVYLAPKRDVVAAVIQHVGEVIAGCELRLIVYDYQTCAYSFWLLDVKTEGGQVRVISEALSSCPDNICLALRSQAETAP